MEIATFPLARYQFRFRVTQEIVLPEYAGSTLRGAFGRALRKISCMTKQADCKGCPLYRTCPYTNIFETPAPLEHQQQKFSQVPNGYIIEPPQWGEQYYSNGDIFSFNLVLFGRVLAQLPLIAFAFQRAFEYSVAKGRGELEDILYFEQDSQQFQSIFHTGKILSHQQAVSLAQNFTKDLTIEIETPLRLQENGVPLSVNKINAQRFFISLAKRISLLSEFHAQKIELDFEQIKQDIDKIEESKYLKWQDWVRYSSRQDQKMKLGGVIGKWQFKNLSPQLAQLLYLGQWLHNGKNATFGLGKYQIL